MDMLDMEMGELHSLLRRQAAACGVSDHQFEENPVLCGTAAALKAPGVAPFEAILIGLAVGDYLRPITAGEALRIAIAVGRIRAETIQ